MNRSARRTLVCAVAVLFLFGCDSSDDPGQAAALKEEPVDLVVDLVIEEAWTMDEMARSLTEETGVAFVLAPEIDPHQRMRDPYGAMSFQQNLKEHLDELEEWGYWSFEWQDGKYIIHER